MMMGMIMGSHNLKKNYFQIHLMMRLDKKLFELHFVIC